MADTARKSAEDRIPFNFFKRVPKIVRILRRRLFLVVLFNISENMKKDFTRR